MTIEYKNAQMTFSFMKNVETVKFKEENPRFSQIGKNTRDLIIEISKSLVGFPSRYCFGESRRVISLEAFSCNEFVLFVLQETKLHFPNLIIPDVYHVNEIWDHLGVSVDEKYAKPGDLIFYAHQRQVPKHVGFFVGISQDGDRYMVDSEGETGGHIVFSRISKNYRDKKFVDNPLYGYGLIGYKRITVKTQDYRWPQSPIK